MTWYHDVLVLIFQDENLRTRFLRLDSGRDSFHLAWNRLREYSGCRLCWGDRTWPRGSGNRDQPGTRSILNDHLNKCEPHNSYVKGQGPSSLHPGHRVEPEKVQKCGGQKSSNRSSSWSWLIHLQHIPEEECRSHFKTHLNEKNPLQ